MNQLESLRSVFKDRIFRIPDYQRGYAWTKRQLRDFWEDIYNLPFNKYHYTGLLSLKEASQNNYRNWEEEKWIIKERGTIPFYVVDGQQRMITFSIFINEIINLLIEINESKNKTIENIYLGSFSLKEIKEDYIVLNKPPNEIVKTYKFGYEKDNPSFRYLRHKIYGEPYGGFIQETFYTLNLENAKNFFKENLMDVYKEKGIEAIEELFRKATQNMMFNIHEIQEEFDVFVAFETMNNRGKKLSNLELLKNRLIYLTTLYNEDELKEDARKILREQVNNAWKEIYFQLGRNKVNPLSDDDFLVAHWVMYFEYTNQRGEDFIRYLLEKKFTPQNVFQKREIKESSLINVIEVEEFLDDEDNEVESIEEKYVETAKLAPNEIENYVGNMKDVAVHWYNAFNPINNKDLAYEESKWLDKLNRIGIAYFRPLVTVSFNSPNVGSKERIKLFKSIERFIFIAFRLGRAFSTYRRNEFYKMARRLAKGEVSVDEICKILNKRLSPWVENNKTFNYQSFKTYIDRLFTNNNGYYSWNGLRYFLYEYELEKVDQLGNQKIDWNMFVKNQRDKVSIEHICPQNSSNEYWEKILRNYSKDQRFILTNTLGNLLPLSMSINSSLQNDSFPNKKRARNQGSLGRRGYREGSHSEIEVAGYRRWNSQAILSRGLQMLSFMERRWGITFKNVHAKKDLLFLDFIK